MDNMKRNSETKKAPKRSVESYMGIGIAIGIAIGAALGVATGKSALFIPLGVAVGAGIGAYLQKKHRYEAKPLSGLSAKERMIAISIVAIAAITVALVILGSIVK